MRKFLQSRGGKSAITHLLLVGTVLVHIKPQLGNPNASMWLSSHAIIAGVWFLCTILHVWQHWGMIRALGKKRILLKNKITALTILCFVLMCASLLALATGAGDAARAFHHVIGHLYVVIVVIHTFVKFKSFRALAHR